jgi:uncharacterized membrane protein (UPF0136 family)
MSLEKSPRESSRRHDRIARRGGSQRRETREEAEHHLEFVQRTIISALVGVVFGSLAAVLAAYLSVWGAQDLNRSQVLGLWVMTGVVGLLTAVGVLVIQKRRPYAPWVLLGLLPMAISAFWVFG